MLESRLRLGISQISRVLSFLTKAIDGSTWLKVEGALLALIAQLKQEESYMRPIRSMQLVPVNDDLPYRISIRRWARRAKYALLFRIGFAF